MGREKAKGEKKSKKEKTRHDKVKRERSKRKEGKRRGGRRPPTPESEYDYYSSYYSYSESRSPSPVRDRKRRGDRERKHRSRSAGRRRRSRTPRRGGGDQRYSPPPRREPSPGRRVDRGGYIPVPGPRSPSRDGSPPNDWIISTLIDREKARMKRDFVEADKIRDELRQKGVEILERERRWQHRDGRSGIRPNADDKRRID